MNIEKDVAESFDDLGYWTVRSSQEAQAQVKAEGAVIRVSQGGGPVDDIEGRYRCVVEVYAATYDQLWDTAREVERRLLRPYFVAGSVVVDKSTNDSSFAERPLSSETRVVTSTWTLTARHHTRRTVVAP
jgi:hypothetical protein